MSEQEMVKVYELAKELGIDSISLLDKLKSLKINVKNHMSELRTEEVQLARASLKKGSAQSAKGSARTTTKTTPKTAKATTKTATKTTKKKTAAESSASSAAATEAHPEKKAASPIIRRRGSVETSITPGPVLKAGTEPQATPPPESAYEGEPATFEQIESQAEGTSLDQGALETSEQTSPTETSPQRESTLSGLEGQSTAMATNTSTQESDLKNAVSPQPSGSAQPQAPSKTGAPAATAPGGIKTITKTKAPIVLTPRPVAPRRSILKIVEPTPPPRPVIIKPAPPVSPVSAPKPVSRGTTVQDKEGFRVIKMTKENLDQMAEDEAAKKRGGAREPELRPEDVRFADYRKKELVFLPKKKKIPVGKEIKQTQKTVAKAQKRIVEMQNNISVQDFANQMSVKANDVIRKLMGMGQMATINQSLDYDTACLVAAEFQYEVKNVAFKEQNLLGSEEVDAPETLKQRPPVVTIMGHVDHGKTTLLDSIREANVAGGEAGGITQHIGAYTVDKNGKLITFIDTPGHEAFTVMRARGANVTDIVILVVAADDGVMPQTREAISHAQAAKVPIIVAVNKIDKPGANPEKIKQTLADLNLLAEDWGGETMFVPVSALKKTNLDKLLDSILLQAEMLDLKANPDAKARGTVLEARLDKGRGPVISVLVSRGTLQVGDPVVAGALAGKVKALTDDKGRSIKSAGPGIAAEVLGLEGVPNAGEAFHSTQTEADARVVADHRADQIRSKVPASASGKVSLEELFSKIQAGDVKELGVVLKADAFGSVEAIRDSLVKLSTDKVKVKPIFAGSGGITESDVLLASASNALIIGFNVRPETKARQVAEAEHVEIKCYNIIYELLDDIKKAMTGLLDKKKVEKFLGRAEVRQVFSVPKIGTIAGSSVIDGKILRGANVRLLRESRVIFEGKMSSLKRFKDDAKEVATGFECGIGIENYNDLKTGDIIEAYQIELVTPELNS